MKKRYILIAGIALFILIFSIALPTFSKFKMGITSSIIWDGTCANSFSRGNGSIDEPYIISNGAELSYFSKLLKTNDFEGKYVKLSNDIVLNEGVFSQEGYIYNDTVYQIDDETSKYYLEDEEIGSINILPTLENFKGTFDGNFHTIYGFYADKALFDNLGGKVENLYLDNAFIHGENYLAGVVLNAFNATIKNVIFNGIVIGNDEINTIDVTNPLDDITVTDTYTLDLAIPNTPNLINEITLSGKCISDTETFMVNDTAYACEDFDIVTSNQITISGNVELTELSYTYSYDENLSAGIVGMAVDTAIDGVVNRGFVNGVNASGIVGMAINTSISNSYNAGHVSGVNVSGIADTIYMSNSSISNVYNTFLDGDNNYGLIRLVSNSTLTIENSFNIDSYAIGNNIDSSLNITNCYNSYAAEFDSNYDDVKNLYPMYIDDENILNGNIWIDDEFPLLYFDDLKNRTLQIKIDSYIWDGYNASVSEINYTESIKVLLLTTDMYKPIKDVYYYLSNDILSKNDLSNVMWQEYTKSFDIDREGIYVVYVKYIDYADNVYYINSGKLVLDMTGASISISNTSNTWKEYHEPESIYVNDNLTYQIDATDLITGVSSIEYVISSSVLTKDELDSITTWNSYNGNITVYDNKYIIYVKVVDNSGYVTYANTDMILNVAYSMYNLKLGNNIPYSQYIKYNSTLSFDVSLSHELVSLTNLKRYLYTDVALPLDTLIIINDDAMIYEYKVSENVYNKELNGYLYALANFKEIGKMTFNNYFNNLNYSSVNEEHFNITLDFSDISQINKDINIGFVAMENDNIISSSKFMVSLQDVDNYISIASSYNGSILYNTFNTVSVPITIGLNSTVVSTELEDLYAGISIVLEDENGVRISRNVYKDLKFEYNGVTYMPDANGITNIGLGKEFNQTVNLNIVTSETNASYQEKTYYFKIISYISADGITHEYESNNYVVVPLEMIKKYNDAGYSFNVTLAGNAVVIKDNNRLLNFNVKSVNTFDNPNIRVSLYKKKELTAYNQEYVLVDLKDYVEDNLDELTENVYYLNNNSLTLKEDVEVNGYKFVFELYDGDMKVTDASILLIIR